MSYAVRRTDTSAAPGSQPTTATVLDYNCLFTHDLKRKQKRWQDGKLRYHTFNKKIMVYDERGNFIGDAHWQAGGDLEEDEELNLDRGAAIVQVADCVGSREQDLTEVLDKRVREVEKRRAVAAAKTPPARRARAAPAGADAANLQRYHRPLSSVIPSPGPLGRAAVSSRSPYEARKADSLRAQEQAPPPGKKRRRSPSPPSKAGFARSLFGAALSLSSSAGGAANVRGRALKERGVIVEELASGGVSDDDVVVVEEKPRAKASLQQSRHLEGAASTKPQRAHEDEISSVVDVDHASEIQRRSSSGLKRDMVDSRVRPESRPALLRDISRKARTIEDEDILEQRSVNISHIVDIPANKSHPQRLTESKQPKGAMRTLAEENQQTQISDGESEGTKTVTSPRLTTKVNQVRLKVTPGKLAPPELPDSAPSEPMERRTELRIRSRQRRGLLMVSERRQGRQTQQSSTTPKPLEQIRNADSTAAARKSFQGGSDETVIDGSAIKATPERTLDTTPTSGKNRQRNDSAPSPLDQTGANGAASDSESYVSAARDNRSEPPEKAVGCFSDSDEVVEHARRRRRKTSTEGKLEGDSAEIQKLPDPIEVDDIRDHVQPDSGDLHIGSPCRERTQAILPREERRRMANAVSEDAAPEQVNIEQCNQDIPDRARRSRHRQDYEVSANISTGGESEGLPPKRKKMTRTGKTIETPLSSEESDCAPRDERLSVKMKNLHSDTAMDPSEEESDCAPRKRSKRRQLKKDCESTVAHQISKVAGPRIKRLARKSVKSKEIFGLVPSVENGPSPFAMTTSRIGVVGRPPTGPNRPSGISFTRKPDLQSHGHGGGATDKQSADKVEHPISGGQLAPKKGDAAAMAPRPDAECPPILNEMAQDDGLVPSAKLVNPATRGKKAARKTDAAGQVPQHVVPFEPLPVQPLPRARPSGPKGRDASLPGFSTAKGGAWSKHAEDLLGMTRPMGKRA